MLKQLFLRKVSAGINGRKTLSARRYLANPSRQTKDELSIRCEDERSGSMFCGFILSSRICYSTASSAIFIIFVKQV